MPSFTILVSAVLALLCGQTHRQNHRQNKKSTRYRCLTHACHPIAKP